MKYLIVECHKLGDQWECDADRTPICITENPSEYGVGYEVWKILSDGTLEKIRGYDKALEEGMALYSWKNEEEVIEGTSPNVMIKYPNKDRDSFADNFFKRLKIRAGFKENVKSIIEDVRYCGSHGEVIGDEWVVFGKYRDSHYDIGY